MFKKGQSGNLNGRGKGSKNLVTRDLVAKILSICDALEKQGKGLDILGKQEPKWFYENFVKPILPKNIDLSIGAGDRMMEFVADCIAQLRKEDAPAGNKKRG